MTKLPYAVTPLANEYKVIGEVLTQFPLSVYTMTQKEFFDTVMRYSKGMMNPNRVNEIYNNLMKDAGLL